MKLCFPSVLWFSKWLVLIIIYVLKNKGRAIETQAGNQEWKFFVVDFPVVLKGPLLIAVLLLKGTQAAHRDLKQWKTARGNRHGWHQLLLEGLC